MSGAGTRGAPERGLRELRSATAAGLRARRREIHEAVVERALSAAPPSGHEAPGYVEALRGAIPAAVEHAFEAIEVGEERVGPAPGPIFAQAAVSARNKVGLEVVMRRYAAGYSTLSDFLHQEIGRIAGASAHGHALLQRELTALFDRLVVEVSEAYRRVEAEALPSPAELRLERIRRLLAGELVEPAGLDYPLAAHHLAVVASGPAPEEALGALAGRLDRRLLAEGGPAGRCAAWLGGGRPFDRVEIEEAAGELAAGGLRLALGEPGEGLAGWRRSRRQAEAAHAVAERGGAGVACYREVALLAAALRDPDLSHFLAEAYVGPLGEEMPVLGETLLSFLGSEGNASSAAAALGVSRKTVAGRLRAAEERIGRPIRACSAQLETALRLAELDG